MTTALATWWATKKRAVFHDTTNHFAQSATYYATKAALDAATGGTSCTVVVAESAAETRLEGVEAETREAKAKIDKAEVTLSMVRPRLYGWLVVGSDTWAIVGIAGQDAQEYKVSMEAPNLVRLGAIRSD